MKRGMWEGREVETERVEEKRTYAITLNPVLLRVKCKLDFYCVKICRPTVSHIQLIGVESCTNSAVASQLTA